MHFSPRQRQVMELVGSGLSYDDTAERLGIAPRTVRLHVSMIVARIPDANIRLLRPRDAVQQFYLRNFGS